MHGKLLKKIQIFKIMKKDISNYSAEQMQAFISGVEECWQMGEVIDLAKRHQWHVTEHLDWGFSIVLEWIKAIDVAPKVSDPTMQGEDVEHYDVHQFQILFTQSKRKLSKEVVDALEELNKESLIINYL